MPVDPESLPEDSKILRQIIVDLTQQLDKTNRLVQQLIAARSGTRSEQLSADQLRLFVQELGIQASEESKPEEKPDNDSGNPPSASSGDGGGKPRGRQALPKHLKRERIVHDLAEADKQCTSCQQPLRHIGEEVSERYEYIPARMLVVEDACQKYACSCSIRTATKPAQPIEKSTASASVLAHVIVSKVADHLPVHRQAKMFRRFGVELADQTLCGWLRQSAELLTPLYERMKSFVLASKVVGTDDTPVKVLDRTLPQTRKGRFWPYVGDREHPAVVYDYTPTRERAGPEKFLSTYKGYLQLDAYPAYDKFFLDPKRELVEVGCWAHAYLLRIEPILLPKSDAGQAFAYILKNWLALTRYLEDGDFAIDNNRTERSLRGIAVARNNWTFLGSDRGGRTMAILRSFVSSCEINQVDPFAWFRDVLKRIASHSIQHLDELLPDRWAAQAA